MTAPRARMRGRERRAWENLMRLVVPSMSGYVIERSHALTEAASLPSGATGTDGIATRPDEGAYSGPAAPYAVVQYNFFSTESIASGPPAVQELPTLGAHGKGIITV